MYKLDSNEVELKGYNIEPYSDSLSIIPVNIITPILIKIISENRFVITKKVDLLNKNMFIEYDIKDYGKIKEQNYLKFNKELSSIISEITGYKLDFLEELTTEIINHWNLYIGIDKSDNLEELLFFSESKRITSKYFLSNDAKW
jgi:hypothetical protein